ncbi:MAG: DUF1778 domain-containing protein [Synergistaceae bacterium]|jgi:uncharacterized protein (DUF1778 family)|nr:DUF1778 domain-containing protein [Synergistaceae bacterium]
MRNQNKAVKNARVEMRIPQSLKAIWQCAAAMQGSSLAEYIVSAVSDRAANDVERQHVIHLTTRDQVALFEALKAPAREPNDRTKRAWRDYKQAVEEGAIVVRH